MTTNNQVNNFRKHKQLSKGFTIIPTSIFMDKRLSNKGLGLLCKILSLPDNWNFTEMGMVAICKDGRDSVRSSLKELEELGYLHRERIRNENGRLDGAIWHVYEIPYEPTKTEDGTLNYEPTTETPQINPEWYYDWMNE